MSLPKDLLDQLLTGYLDDALSVDERARVDQLLKSDPAVADELEQLRELRGSLKAVAKADAKVKLDAGFADRVLVAAVARARSEGLPDDHPLIRLAEQPSTTPAPQPTSTTYWRNVGLLVGLAASIAIAVITLRPQSNDILGIAAVEVDPGVPDRIAEDSAVAGDPFDSSNAAPQMIASADSSNSQSASQSAVTNSPATTSLQQPSATDAVAAQESLIQEPLIQEPLIHKPAPTEALADRGNRSATPAGSSVVDESTVKVGDQDVSVSLGAIIVLDVRRSDAGREANAVEAALANASIETSKKDVTDEIVGFVNENVDAEASGDDVSLIYLNVSAKKFDRFYAQLWNDRQGIESVQMKMVMDAPLMKWVDAIRPDPTAVRHSGEATYELFGAGSVVDQLEQIEYPPMRDRSEKFEPSSLGPDIQSEVLVLVR